MATEAVNIDDVTRGCEPLQRNSINAVVFLEVIFKVVFVSEIDKKDERGMEECVRTKMKKKIQENQE